MENILPVMAILCFFGAVALVLIPSKTQRAQRSKKKSAPRRGDRVIVKIDGQEVRAVLLDDPKPAPKSGRVPPAYR
jgi:hypothetical protein